MRALILGEAEQKCINELIAFAAANVLDAKVMAHMPAEAIPAFRDMMNLMTIVLPVGYSVTYSLERQPPGILRHISIAVEKINKTPNPAAVDMILQAFGMQPFAASLSVWVEDLDGGFKAVNVVQPLVSAASNSAAEPGEQADV